MKKFLSFFISAALVLSFFGCNDETETSEEENVFSKPEFSEESQAEEKDEWEKFIEEISFEQIGAEEIEGLQKFGYKKEEIIEMETWKIRRALRASELGISKETLSVADELVENPEIANDDKQFISFGLYSTVRTEYVENFLLSVEKNEPCRVAGILVGYTMPFFFEISYEPGGPIKIVNIWREAIRFAEMTEVYETKSFWHFTDGNGNDFSVLKSATGDKTIDESYVPGSDIPGMPVTAKEAAAEAEKIFAISFVNRERFGNDKSVRLYGSWGSAVREEDYEAGKVLMGNGYEPVVYSGAFIDGKPYYCVSLYYGGNDIGCVYCVGAEDINSVYNIGMANGETVPIEYIDEPRIIIEKD